MTEIKDAEFISGLMSNHQVASAISLPTDPELFEQVLTRDQYQKIFQQIGRKELERLASIGHESNDDNLIDYSELAKREGSDLKVLRTAITKVTGKENPWIVGFASDFAKSLLKYVDQESIK